MALHPQPEPPEWTSCLVVSNTSVPQSVSFPYAVDIDPDAVRVARENVEHNGLEKVIDVQQGDLLQGLSRTFDFAVANILAPVICMLAAPLKKHLAENGIFVCSGIIKEAEEDVRQALDNAGYIIDEVCHQGDWVAFACHI